MKIIVYPHDLVLGGSPINAIDLAAGVRDLGHDVAIYGIPGPLVQYIASKGLPFYAARTLRYRPAPSRIVQLARLAHRLKADIIHAYEWPPTLDAFFGAHCLGRIQLLCTVLSMEVPPFVPATVPLIMGTRELAAQAKSGGRQTVDVIEPPVDLRHDQPGNHGASFREKFGVGPAEHLVVCVSRLSSDLKLGGLIDAIDGVGQLAAAGEALKLIFVGDGDAADAVRARALAINDGVGRDVVAFAGALNDPRAAYAAADVVVGMGSTILRGMAHGKPVIVQGTDGFAELLDEDSWPMFEWQGFFGRGERDRSGTRLAAALRRLLAHPERRAALGELGLRLVREKFDLDGASRRLATIYHRLATERSGFAALAMAAVQSSVRALGEEVRLHTLSTGRLSKVTRIQQLRTAATPAPLISSNQGDRQI
jgi:glycosyltransferase involved in cell wall biosynthesis